VTNDDFVKKESRIWSASVCWSQVNFGQVLGEATYRAAEAQKGLRCGPAINPAVGGCEDLRRHLGQQRCRGAAPANNQRATRIDEVPHNNTLRQLTAEVGAAHLRTSEQQHQNTVDSNA